MGFVNSYRYGGAPVIPTPEVGVCTPYPIAVPVTTDLIGYYSCFNSCDSYTDISETTTVSVSGDSVRSTTDLSSSGNAATNLLNTEQAADIIDNGLGDVYWKNNTGSSVRAWSPDVSWRMNTDVKTIMYLCWSDNVALNTTTRIGINNNFQLRFNGGNLSVSNGGNQDSSLAGTSNQWMVISCRTDDNIVLGMDKSYEEVSAIVPSAPTGDFSIWARRMTAEAARWNGRIREIAIFSESLSDSNVDTMTDYMKDKWGL
jgi:hypothetical protein